MAGIPPFYDDIKWLKVDSASISSDTNGADIDLQGYNGCLLITYVGASGSVDSTNFIELQVEHADEDATTPDTAGTYADVANADLTNYVTGSVVGTYALVDDATEDDTFYVCEYIGRKRYIRVRYEETGTFGAAQIATLAGKTGVYYKPAN